MSRKSGCPLVGANLELAVKEEGSGRLAIGMPLYSLVLAGERVKYFNGQRSNIVIRHLLADVIPRLRLLPARP